MPCHTGSWIRAYPLLGSGSALDPSRESTYRFLKGLIHEMTSLFPDAYFHAGGDECDFHQWESNPRIRKYMRAHHIKDGAALQALFTARIQKMISANGKIMIGWDEVLQPGTPHDVVIQSWRGPKSLVDAALQGNRALLSSGYYLDLNESAAEHYLVDPLGDPSAATLTPKERAGILGAEAAMWTDIVSDANLDNRVWPRAAAIAERLWSPRDVRDIDSMYRRLTIVSMKLEYYGLRHRLITEEALERMSGNPNPVALRVLAGTVQPPPGYERQQLRNFSDFTPLNRLDDVVPPESDTAREFDGMAKRIASGKAAQEDWQHARQWLVLWKENDAKLEPLLKRSFLTQDLEPVSRSLSQVAEIGLQALDDLESNRTVTAEARQRNLDFLENASKPHSVLVLMVAPSVRRLVDAEELMAPQRSVP